MSGRFEQHVRYLPLGGESAMAMHHPASGEPAPAGVVLAPPFGWDDMCSYRSRRSWAADLAARGHHVLRLGFPDAGDGSADWREPGRLDAWVAAVSAAAGALGAVHGCTRVAVIGIGAGGLAACLAVAAGAPVDDLVLWGVPSRGALLTRELRAFARLEAAGIPPGPPFEVPPGPQAPGLVAGGYALSTETLDALKALDLHTALPAGSASDVRALVLERDGLAVDGGLVAALEQAGAQVTAGPGPGYARLMAEPAYTEPPRRLFEPVAAWIAAVDAPSTRPAGAAEEHDVLRLRCGEREATERMLTVERDFGRIFGILTEPAGDPAPLAVIALNAGALNHTGPNRMWVEAARRWAARGVTTLRLDVEGIGDADGDGSQWTDVGSFYVPSLVVQVRAAMDELERRAIAGRFLLLGLCSGAYWAFHAGAQDERVAAALMVNPRTLLWDVRHHEAREARRIRRVTSPQALRRLTPRRAGEVLGAVAARAARAPVARREERERLGRLDAAFDALSDRGCRATMLFTGDEPLWEEMAADGRVPAGHWPNVSVELLSPAPETHTLRPPGLQRLVHERLDAALERELDLAARES